MWHWNEISVSHLLTLILFKPHMTDFLFLEHKKSIWIQIFHLSSLIIWKNVCRILPSIFHKIKVKMERLAPKWQKSIIKIVQLLKQYDSFVCYSLIQIFRYSDIHWKSSTVANISPLTVWPLFLLHAKIERYLAINIFNVQCLQSIWLVK